MTESTQDKADKIQKLLNKAESAGPAEAELLTAKAMEMMQRYGIEAAELDERRKRQGHAGESIITDSTIKIQGSYVVPISDMFWKVLHLSDNVRAFQTKNKGVTTIYLTGYQSDVEQMKLLLVSLEIQALMAMRAFWLKPETAARVQEMNGSEKWNERRAFVMGFGNGVRTRLEAAKRSVQSEPGTALVLARGTQVDQYMADNFKLRSSTARSRVGGTSDARRAGHEAGKRAATGGEQIGQRGRLGDGK